MFVSIAIAHLLGWWTLEMDSHMKIMLKTCSMPYLFLTFAPFFGLVLFGLKSQLVSC